MYKVDELSVQRTGINYVNSRCSYDASLLLSFSTFLSFTSSYVEHAERVAERIGAVRKANWR